MVRITNRPWGRFLKFTHDKKSTVKILEVKPHKELSLQYHNHRSEMWYFFNKAKVVLGNKTKRVKAGETVNIPVKTKHRIISLDEPVRVLEIATGKFSEADIVRVEDKYGRR